VRSRSGASANLVTKQRKVFNCSCCLLHLGCASSALRRAQPAASPD
jgi:hypothetical protein